MTDTKKDNDLWAEVTRDVRPLDKSASKPAQEKPVARSIRPPSGPLSYPRPRGPVHQSPFDPALFKKIADGKVPLDVRLDLHGLTEARAHEKLSGVLEGAWAEGRRRVLVITGRGRAGSGTIRGMLPKWLSAPNLAPYVSSFTPAGIKHGGDGAFYVLLRKLTGERGA